MSLLVCVYVCLSLCIERVDCVLKGAMGICRNFTSEPPQTSPSITVATFVEKKKRVHAGFPYKCTFKETVPQLEKLEKKPDKIK